MKQTNYFSKWIFLILLLGLYSIDTAYAQDDLQRKKHFNIAKSGFLLDGYDPVAYQAQKRAIKGDPSISVIYKGVKYAFTSTANRELFKSNPAKYEPAYGGWCAYAMGYSGEKVEVDPETFKVIDGKTYLFYNFYFNNTLKSWNKDEKNLQLKANQNWMKIIP
jgi:YHS domain-containing protein